MTDKHRDNSTIVAVALALAGFAISAYAAYSHNDKETAQRITVVETQQRNDGKTIERVENKVDLIDDKQDLLDDKLDDLRIVIEYSLGRPPVRR